MKFFLLGFILFFAWALSSPVFAVNTFDWNGNGTNWASSNSWNESGGGSGDYPGSKNNNDIVRFGVASINYTNQPTLSNNLTVASVEFGGGSAFNGTVLTVNGATLTVTGLISQDINTIANLGTYNYMQGSGTITCGSFQLGSNSTSISGNNNYMLSDIATLNITGNLTIYDNTSLQNGSGFRLENGNMTLTGQILFSNPGNSNGTNSSYFTINTKTQSGGVATTPNLYFLNANPIPAIPFPKSTVNLYGDHNGVGTVIYSAANPSVVTTSTNGFGTGNYNTGSFKIDTSATSYDNLTIQASSGTTTIGANTSTLGALKVAGNFITNTPTTFNTTGGTNTSVGGNWSNAATITGGAGSTAVTGSVTNSGTMDMAGGILEVGANLTNTNTINAGSGDITVDGNTSTSGALKMSSGSLTMSGNYTNTGTFTAGTGAVNFNSTDAQLLTDNSAAGSTFNIVNFTGGGLKTMSGTGGFGVADIGVLTMAGGNTLATGAVLSLYSTANSTATVAAIPSNSGITGTVNAHRYISGGSNKYRGYRMLSSPIYTATTGSGASAAYYFSLAYLAGFAPVTGSLGTTGGLTKGGNPSMYLYRDNQAFTNNAFNTGNFRGINRINNSPAYDISVDYDTGPNVNGSYSLHPGTGVLFFYRGNLNNIATKYILTTVAEVNDFVQTGTLNQQDVTVVNWYTGLPTLQYSTVTGNTGYSGYNLVGNPYFSSINWDTYSTGTGTGITAPNVGVSTYIYNEVAKNYAVYNAHATGGTGTNGATNIIPSGQAFFVKATTTGASLTFHESAKTNAQVTGPTAAAGNTLLLSTSPVPVTQYQFLRLQLVGDSVDSDETIISFNGTASNTYNINEDSEYFVGNGIVGLATYTADSYACAINSMPLPKQSVAVKLDTRIAQSGLYTLIMKQLQRVPQLYDIWLMDKYKGDSLDMRHKTTYAFDVTLSDTNSYGNNRFKLVIRINPALGVHLLAFNAAKTQSGAQLTWKTENEQNYTNFTVERSSDNGTTFDVVGGSLSTAISTYTLLDRNPPAAVDLYRLKIEDLNGNITYSNIQTLSYANTNNAFASNINVYPNPAAATINLSITPNGPVTPSNSFNILITNGMGTVIKNANSAQTVWQDNVSNLLPGTYIIQVVNNNDKSVVGKSKFVKL